MRLLKKQLIVFTVNITMFLGLISTITNYSTSYFEGQANIIEKSINIDINDFYYQTSVPSIFTSGQTTGTAVTGNNTSTCGITVTGSLGHTAGDINNGLRINDNTLFLRFSFGSKTFTGISGFVYTATARSFRITTNSTPGVSSYVKGNEGTYTPTSTTTPTTTLNNPVEFNKIIFATTFTGEVEIRASGSAGFTNLVIYYLD